MTITTLKSFAFLVSVQSGPVPVQGTAPAPNQIAALWELIRRLGAKISFSSVAPDRLWICRYFETRRPSDVSCAEEFRPEEVMAAGEKRRRGEVALRVLHSLPAQHEKFFYREIRILCTDFVTSLGMPQADRASAAGELLSEVMAKLLGAGSSINIDDDMQQANRFTQKSTSDDQWPFDSSFQTNMETPERDDRVRWLIKEVGGGVLSHTVLKICGGNAGDAGTVLVIVRHSFQHWKMSNRG